MWFGRWKTRASRQWAEAAVHLLLNCFKPPHGTALAEAKLARSDAWLKTVGDAPPMVFAPDALDIVKKMLTKERPLSD